MLNKVVVKFKDGSYCNLPADFIQSENGIVQVWNGENVIVGVFNIVDIIGLYMTEKKAEG